MSRYVISAMGSMLVAAVVSASPVLAAPGDGDYYQGANRNYSRGYGSTERYQALRRAPAHVDRMPVGSIFGGHKNVRNGGEGEYYQGPNRN